MLAGAVDLGEGLFVQQADEAVAVRDLLHHLHRELVVVAADVRVAEYRRELVLRRRDFVVLRLRHYAELPELLVELCHELRDARPYRAEVMVVELLSLRRLRSEERAPRVAQVLALFVELFIYEEIFLLRADGRRDVRRGVVAEEAQNAQRLRVDDLHRTQQRRLLVEHFPAV